MRQLSPKSDRLIYTAVWMLIDALLVNVALVLAQLLRYSVDAEQMVFFRTSLRMWPIMTAAYLLCYAIGGIYRTMWQYAAAGDTLRIAVSAFAADLLTYLLSLAANALFGNGQNLFRLHRMVYLLHWIIAYALTATARLIYNLVITKKRTNRLQLTSADVKRVMIVGAGWNGANLIHDMQNGGCGDRVPVVAVDDQRERIGSRISGVPVVRGTSNIIKLCSTYRVDEIVIAIATPHQDLSQLVEKCLSTGCKVHCYSPIQAIDTTGEDHVKIREVNIGDLLGRPEESLDMSGAADFFRDRTVLITGGGGSIGSELCRRLIPMKPKKIVLYDISENYMYDLLNELKQQYGSEVRDRLELCVASVRDEERLDDVFARYQPQVVLHAAAHKHVPLMEDCPDQAVKNNVFGTYYTALAAMRHHVERFVLISTDKAVNPTNVMGATKRIAEMIVKALNGRSETEFVSVRFGNVLGSHGSVIPLFERQIRSGGPVTVTHPDMVRYFMTIPEAASLVLQAASIAEGGELFVLDMGKPVRIKELAEQMIRLYAPKDAPKIEIEYTGLRKGEKLYEELLLGSDGVQNTSLEKIFVAKPEQIPYEQIEELLTELKSVLTSHGDMLACLHRLVPEFRSAEEVNAAAGAKNSHA